MSIPLPNPIVSTALATPEAEVVVAEDGTLTAAALVSAASRGAHILAARSLGPHSTIALVGPPSAAWVTALHAVGWLGASVLPLPAVWPVAALEQALRLGAPDAAIFLGMGEAPRGDTEAAYLSRALTTVRQDLAYLATFGVGMLVDAIENPRPQDRRENVPVELVIRETTAAPPPRR